MDEKFEEIYDQLNTISSQKIWKIVWGRRVAHQLNDWLKIERIDVLIDWLNDWFIAWLNDSLSFWIFEW